ncbi:MAG: hypothetical protein HC888_03240 [Candidatus Competibacteraceae bacterium]|nr:hypothetical protein [Candidatus Competibacteraceae bacterium]
MTLKNDDPVDDIKDKLNIDVDNEVAIAMRYLHKEGQMLYVDYGYKNAIDKANHVWAEKWISTFIQAIWKDDATIQ